MQMQPTSHAQTPENPAGTSSVRRSPRDGEILCIGAACRGSQDDMVAHVHAGRPARHAGLLRPAHVGCLLRCVLSCSTLLAAVAPPTIILIHHPRTRSRTCHLPPPACRGPVPYVLLQSYVPRSCWCDVHAAKMTDENGCRKIK